MEEKIKIFKDSKEDKLENAVNAFIDSIDIIPLNFYYSTQIDSNKLQHCIVLFYKDFTDDKEISPKKKNKYKYKYKK